MDTASEAKLSGVAPALAAIVRQMAANVAAQGGTLRVISGLRSYAQQAALYANRANNSNPVAVPGTSKHERGEAVDLSWSGVNTAYVGALGEGFGLRWGGRFKRTDPGHFEIVTSGSAAVVPAPTVTPSTGQTTSGGATDFAPILAAVPEESDDTPGAGGDDDASGDATGAVVAGLILLVAYLIFD